MPLKSFTVHIDRYEIALNCDIIYATSFSKKSENEAVL